MKLKYNSLLNIFFLLFAVFFSKILLAEKISASYKIELAGINVGNMHWDIHFENNSYKSAIILKDGGLFSGLYKFSGIYLSEGLHINNEFISKKYEQNWKTKKKTRYVKIFFKNESPIKLILKPDEKEPPRLDFFELKSVNDPIASFSNLLFLGLDKQKTTDGRRVYDMIIDYEKEERAEISKKILIKKYKNIWADHSRNDLEYIYFEQKKQIKKELFPDNIKIKNKGLVFKLTKI